MAILDMTDEFGRIDMVGASKALAQWGLDNSLHTGVVDAGRLGPHFQRPASAMEWAFGGQAGFRSR